MSEVGSQPDVWLRYRDGNSVSRYSDAELLALGRWIEDQILKDRARRGVPECGLIVAAMTPGDRKRHGYE
jgi:hypothetical protein